MSREWLATGFERIGGPVAVWLAPVTAAGVAEAPPDVGTTPAGNWVNLGATVGDVTIEATGGVTLLFSNDAYAADGAARQDDGIEITFTLLDQTLEIQAQARGDLAGDVATNTTPDRRTLAHARGAINFKSLLLIGADDSPYEAGVRQRYFPICANIGNPREVRRIGLRVEKEYKYAAIYDANQAAGEELGIEEAEKTP